MLWQYVIQRPNPWVECGSQKAILRKGRLCWDLKEKQGWSGSWREAGADEAGAEGPCVWQSPVGQGVRHQQATQASASRQERWALQGVASSPVYFIEWSGKSWGWWGLAGQQLWECLWSAWASFCAIHSEGHWRILRTDFLKLSLVAVWRGVCLTIGKPGPRHNQLCGLWQVT